MNKTIALALATFALAIPAAAHGRDDDQRQDRRDVRPTVVVVDNHARDAARRDDTTFDNRTVDVEAIIRRGQREGALTHRETDMLRAQLRDVDQLKRRAWRDGRLSHGEARQVARAEDRLLDNLRRQLRDGDRRRDDRGPRFDDHGYDNRSRGDDRQAAYRPGPPPPHC